MGRISPYDRTIRDIVDRLKAAGANIDIEHNSEGYALFADGGSRHVSLRYKGRDMLIYLTAYCKGREDEALAQMAGEPGTDLPDVPPVVDSEDPGVKH